MDGDYDGNGYKAQISYSYTIDDQEYTNDELSPYYGISIFKKSHKKLTEIYRKSDHKSIYVNPQKHEQSFLDISIHKQSTNVQVLTITFFLTIIGLYTL